MLAAARAVLNTITAIASNIHGVAVAWKQVMRTQRKGSIRLASSMGRIGYMR
jgi:hypothetical protein